MALIEHSVRSRGLLDINNTVTMGRLLAKAAWCQIWAGETYPVTLLVAYTLGEAPQVPNPLLLLSSKW